MNKSNFSSYAMFGWLICALRLWESFDNAIKIRWKWVKSYSWLASNKSASFIWKWFRQQSKNNLIFCKHKNWNKKKDFVYLKFQSREEFQNPCPVFWNFFLDKRCNNKLTWASLGRLSGSSSTSLGSRKWRRLHRSTPSRSVNARIFISDVLQLALELFPKKKEVLRNEKRKSKIAFNLWSAGIILHRVSHAAHSRHKSSGNAIWTLNLTNYLNKTLFYYFLSCLSNQVRQSTERTMVILYILHSFTPFRYNNKIILSTRNKYLF